MRDYFVITTRTTTTVKRVQAVDRRDARNRVGFFKQGVLVRPLARRSVQVHVVLADKQEPKP